MFKKYITPTHLNSLLLCKRDASGKIIWLSDAFKELLNIFNENDNLNEIWQNNLIQPSPTEISNLINDAILSKSSFTIKYKLKFKNQIKHIVENGIPILNNNKELISYDCHCIDITKFESDDIDIKEYTESLEMLIQERILALHEKENQLKYFIESLPDIAWILDHNERFLYVNNAFLEFYGLPLFSVIKKTPFDILEKSEAKIQSDENNEILSGKKPIIKYEKVLQSASGEFFYFEIIKKPIFNHVNDIIGLCGVARNITHQKKYEYMLKDVNRQLELQVAERTYNLNNEKKKLELIYKLVPSGIFTTNQNCIITSWNPKMTEITGILENEIMYKQCPFYNICCHHDIPVEKLNTYESITTEYQFNRKDGNNIFIRKKTSLLKDENDNIIGRIETVDDITDKHKLEIELTNAKINAEIANKMKTHFLANMSHEIRTPLNAIIGFSDLLSISNLSNDQKELVSHIKTSSNALLALINDILDISKIEAGKLVLENISFSLENILNEVATITKPLLLNKNINLKLPSNIIKHNLIGDPTRLRQVILNLVTNAIKFSNGKDIEIIFELLNLTKTQTTFTLAVKDYGIGIEEDKLENIFLPFVQADTSTTRNYGGTGLGLAISNQIIKLMGGERIFVESKINEGSKFYFTLTLNNDENSLIYEPSRAFSGGGTPLFLTNQKLNILFLEENEANVLLMQKIINKLEHTVINVNNLNDLFKMISNQNIDLILIDISTCENNNIDVILLINEINQKLPIYIFAHDISDEKLNEYVNNKTINGILSKPFKFNEIESIINNIKHKYQNQTKIL